ncbi:phosphocholine cytidylyltransferase family protein [Helicobacter fennelliae]|uniref:phosphocholine cytidylyltransferase family protein n=1 Tax=Helicobacter fennelliae TaxID=215 RepID=UPI000DFB0FFF|nr:phosphocholine cytidylyltransferase family protein [Helicobacter fennelliae]STQ84464.1 sugar nucleotidyltransferase [Helicobacter fennelliae]
MIAVILAAGLGSRLRGLNGDLPKGFLRVSGLELSLIERSIALLSKFGINKIIIGTGYNAKEYDKLALKYSHVLTHKNEHFANTGSAYTLECLRGIIDEDFLLLESDLLYESKALKTLLEDNHKDLILASSLTQSGDEVFLEIVDSKLKNLSKNQSELNSINAELVGISKISLDTFKKLDFTKVKDYEYLLKNFQAKIENNLIWCEIDCLEHLHRAQEKIIPYLDFKDLKITKEKK